MIYLRTKLHLTTQTLTDFQDSYIQNENSLLISSVSLFLQKKLVYNLHETWVTLLKNYCKLLLLDNNLRKSSMRTLKYLEAFVFQLYCEFFCLLGGFIFHRKLKSLLKQLNLSLRIVFNSYSQIN